MRHGLFWTLTALALFRAFVLGDLSGDGTVDANFFTYQNFMMCFAALIFLILSLFKRQTFKFFTVFGLPFYWGTTTFVSIAIIVIVRLNDGVFMKSSTENGGLHSVAEIHTGDAILHYWPSAELLIQLFLLKDDYTCAFHDFYDRLPKLGKACYTLYFLFVTLAVLALYMSTFPFLINYPTPISKGAVVALVIALAIVVEAVLFMLLYFSKPPKHLRHAPIKG